MTAGLFAQHGVFFGDCMPPAPINAKGFFENKWFKAVLTGEASPQPQNIPGAWERRRRNEGWAEGTPWGLKFGANLYGQVGDKFPDVKAIACCYRPRSQVRASRGAINWRDSMQSIESCRRIMDELVASDPRAVAVRTDYLAQADLDQIRPAFDLLGVEFDEAVALDWIDPDLWHHRGDDDAI